MNTFLKKILITLIIVLILALLGLLLYTLFFRADQNGNDSETGDFPESEEGENGQTQEDGEIIPSPEKKVKVISTERVLSPIISQDENKVTYYSQYNGSVWESSFDGSNLTRISSKNLENLVDIIWSPDKNKVVSIFQNEQENITKSIYDYKTGEIYPLDSNIKNIVWSPDSNNIGYQYLNEQIGQNSISIANSHGQSWQNIFNLRMNDINLNWSSSGISFFQKPSGLAKSSLFLLNPASRQLTKVLSEIYGLSVKWSPQGDKLIFSKTSQKGENLNLYSVSKNGVNEINLDLPSFIEKCAWSKDNRTIFCAIPKELSSASVLPDDYYKGAFTSIDEFWKINLETGEKARLLEPWERSDEEYDAIKLFLSPLEDYLFFVNKKNGLLYSVEL